MPLESGTVAATTSRAASPILRVQRASITDTTDYFSRPVTRQSFKRNASDTIMAAFAAFERESPFGRRDVSPGGTVLPQFSPAPSEEALTPLPRRNTGVNPWQALNRRDYPALVPCMAGCLVFSVALSMGFILGLYVALNHLDPPLGQRAVG